MMTEKDSLTVYASTENVALLLKEHASVKIFTPLPQRHEFHCLIGRVASEWAHVEHALDAAIWELLGTAEDKAACVTSQIMGVGGRCKALHNLCRLRGVPEPLLKKIRALMNHSYPIADHRARVVHDPWYFEHSSETPGQFKAMSYKDPRHGHQESGEDEINETIKEIRELRSQTDALLREIWDAVYKSQEKR
jgi:hypothetical protein